VITLAMATLTAHGNANLPPPNLTLVDDKGSGAEVMSAVDELSLQWNPVHGAQSYRIVVRDPNTQDILANQPAVSAIKPYLQPHEIIQLNPDSTSAGSARMALQDLGPIITKHFPWSSSDFPINPSGRLLHAGVSACSDYVGENCGEPAWVDVYWRFEGQISMLVPDNHATHQTPERQPTFQWQSNITMPPYSHHLTSHGRRLVISADHNWAVSMNIPAGSSSHTLTEPLPAEFGERIRWRVIQRWSIPGLVDGETGGQAQLQIQSGWRVLDVPSFVHGFTWSSAPIAPETVQAFGLHPGAAGRQLQEGAGGTARLHPTGQTCTSCHGGGSRDPAPDLTRMNASRFCTALATLNSPSKPESLRAFFADWHERGCPQ